MARTEKSKGFIQLEWVCPNCNSRNLGPKKTCESCGAAQPENVQFYAPAEAKLIQDTNVAKAAKAGADIHCGFCGTRNPATAAVCSQCGGDLKEGKARQAGREMQREAPIVEVKCTNCGEMNPSTRRMCSNCGAPLPRAAGEAPSVQKNAGGGADATGSAAKRKFPWLILGGVVACLVVVCIGAYMLFAPSKTVTATVSEVYWQTSVPLQEMQSVNYSNEQGSPPAGAYNVSCYDDVQQVCEQKTVDQGNGYAEVVEECHDETTQYCSYTVDEWTTIQTYTLEGYDLFPVYSDPNLFSGQRLGEATLTLDVHFTSGGEGYLYHPDSMGEFQMFAPGSTWTLHLNALGGVVSVE
ncbi:MAG: zinc ribbon domain-containing protein [Anaerolineaceae bacterium]|nr:MAG: zinc ribbon domain-containing protein [Anaerolineaceae bacterium]